MLVTLCGLQSPINVGMILRTAEVFGRKVQFCDTSGITKSSANIDVIRDFSCGAFDRGALIKVVDSFESFQIPHGNRLIAATDNSRGICHQDFDWEPSDWLIIGNEYDGIPPIAMRRATYEITIQMPTGFLPKPPSNLPIDNTRNYAPSNNGQKSLNACVAASVIIAAAHILA